MPNLNALYIISSIIIIKINSTYIMRNQLQIV